MRRPSSVPARNTRMAISPRLAHKIFLKGTSPVWSSWMKHWECELAVSWARTCACAVEAAGHGAHRLRAMWPTPCPANHLQPLLSSITAASRLHSDPPGLSRARSGARVFCGSAGAHNRSPEMRRAAGCSLANINCTGDLCIPGLEAGLSLPQKRRWRHCDWIGWSGLRPLASP